MMKKYLIALGVFIFIGSGNSAYASTTDSSVSSRLEVFKISVNNEETFSKNKDVTLSRTEREQQEQTNTVKNLPKSTSKNFRNGIKRLQEQKVGTPDYSSASVNSTKGSNTVMSVRADVTELKLKKGQSKKINAYTAFRDGSSVDNMKWKSSNLYVAKVDGSGNVRAVGKGKAYIIVSSVNDFTKKRVIKVTVKS